MISIKSAREIEIMRRGGKITSSTLSKLIAAARPGVTTGQLNQLADDSIRSMGGVPTFIGYHGYPAAICSRSTSGRRSRATSRTRRSRSRSGP